MEQYCRSNVQTNLFIFYIYLYLKYKQRRVRYIIFILLIFLSVAVITDILYDKIFNGWLLTAAVTGLSLTLWQDGAGGFIWAVISMTLPVMVLYPLFMIGGLGAGDIKLLAVTGCFLSVRGILVCLALSFLIGAVISLLKMLAEHNFPQRMEYLLSYILDVFKSREWKLYEQDIQEQKKKNEGRIHFALPVLLGVILYKGGTGW